MNRLLLGLCVMIGMSSTGLAGIVYDSQGFESFNVNTNLVGQTNGTPAREWESFNGASGDRFDVTSPGFLNGNRVVSVGGASDTGAFVAPAINQFALPGEIWVVEVDIARTIALFQFDPSSPGFNVDIYPSASAVQVDNPGLLPDRILQFGLGVNANNDAIEPFVNVFNGSNEGTDVLLSNLDVSNQEFVHFRAELDFDNESFRVIVTEEGGMQEIVSSGFVNPAADYGPNVVLDFGDADLNHNPALGTTDTGYFDNYVISTVPEPGSGLLLLGTLVGCSFHRRRARASRS